MLTGRQIREGRRLVGKHPCQLATAAGVSTATVLMAEMRDEPKDRPSIDDRGRPTADEIMCWLAGRTPSRLAGLSPA